MLNPEIILLPLLPTYTNLSVGLITRLVGELPTASGESRRRRQCPIARIHHAASTLLPSALAAYRKCPVESTASEYK